MAKDNPEWEDPWEANTYHTGSFTGQKGNKGKAVWNPYAQKIEKMTLEDYNDMTSAYRKENGERMFIPYQNVFGEMVFGYRPEETHMGMTPSGESILISGSDPFAGNRPTINNPANNTPVPDTIPNPNFDPNKVPEAPLPQEGGPKFGYPGSGSQQDAWDSKITNLSPEERAAWEEAVAAALKDGSGGTPPPSGSGGTPPPSGSGGTPPPSGDGDPWVPPSYGVEGSVFDNQFNWNSGEAPPAFQTEYWLGEDAPWGNAGVAGDNASFYKQQLNNLRAQEQGYQESAIGAALRRQAAANQPAELPADPFDWAYGGKGLPTVGVAGGTMDNPTAYALRSYVQPGETSNADIIRKYGAFDTGNMERWLADNSDWENKYNWSRANNPQDLINTLSRDPAELATSNYDFLSRIYNDMFVQQGIETPEGGGPSAAPGYALPIGAR